MLECFDRFAEAALGGLPEDATLPSEPAQCAVINVPVVPIEPERSFDTVNQPVVPIEPETVFDHKVPRESRVLSVRI
jgi:hypothetical protein